MNTTITPTARFIAVDTERSFRHGDPKRAIISQARYWESFPGSYTAEQVTAAQRLIWALGQGIATIDDYTDVQALMGK